MPIVAGAPQMETQSAFMAGAAALVLLLAVLRDRRDRQALVFGALILAFAAWSAGRGLDGLGLPHGLLLEVAGGVLLGALTPTVAAGFGGRRAALLPYRIALWLGAGALGGALLFMGPDSEPLRIATSCWLLLGVASGAALLRSSRDSRPAEEAPDATRLRYLASAHVLVAIGAGVDLVAWRLGGPQIAGLLVPLLYLYAGYLHLLRVRVADLRQLMGNAITLTLVATTLAGAYALLGLWVGFQLDVFAFNAFVVSFVLLLFLDPLQGRIQRSVERYFAPGRLELERTFRPFAERIASVFTLDELLAELLEAIESSGRIRSSAIFLREDPVVGFQQAGSVGLAPRRRVNLIRTPTWVTALETGEPLLREELEKERRGERRDDDIGRAALLLGTMKELDAQLVLPLSSGEHLVGFWTLRDESATEPFSTTEVSFLADVADRLAATIENTRTFERVRARDRFASLGEMASGMAHEIRNPLATIRAAAAMLDDPGGEPTAEIQEMIAEEIQRLDRLVDSFLNYAKPSGQPRAIRDVAEFVTGCVDAVTRLHGCDGVALQLDIASSLPALMANADQLERVISNVVQNAYQAVEANGTIRVRVGRGHAEDDLGPCIDITVEDDGPGMDEGTLARAFIPFFTTKPAGTGLGLALCERLLQSIGGSIHLQSRPGQGASALIRLPSADEPADASP